MSAPSTMRKSFSWLDLPGYAKPFGGQVVIDSLRAHGHAVEDLRDVAPDKTILLSLYWCEALYEWVRFRHRHGIKYDHPVIIGGNHATGSPRAVAAFCKGVYMGDADEWDGVSLRHIYAAGCEIPEPCVVPEIPRRCITMEAKAVAKQSFPIMELSRGCKYRCHYCQYSWMKPYRENDADFIMSELANVGGKVRLSSADIPQHSRYHEIEAALESHGVHVTNQDGALFTLKRAAQGLTKMQRFGVDGMSDRLRKMVRKPIRADWLVERIGEYSRMGVGRCLAYNLFGLPTETREDFLEWDDTVRRIVDAVQPPFTWVNSWNAFLPMPFTPLADGPSSWDNDHRDLAMMARTREYAKARGVNVFDMPERTGNAKITMRMLAIRGTEATAHVIATLALRPNTPEWKILREFERVEGYHLHGQRPEKKY